MPQVAHTTVAAAPMTPRTKSTIKVLTTLPALLFFLRFFVSARLVRLTLSSGELPFNIIVLSFSYALKLIHPTYASFFGAGTLSRFRNFVFLRFHDFTIFTVFFRLVPLIYNKYTTKTSVCVLNFFYE